MKRAVVIAPHRAPDRPPIQVEPGDNVTVGERDSEWPQFVWTALATKYPNKGNLLGDRAREAVIRLRRQPIN